MGEIELIYVLSLLTTRIGGSTCIFGRLTIDQHPFLANVVASTLTTASLLRSSQWAQADKVQQNSGRWTLVVGQQVLLIVLRLVLIVLELREKAVMYVTITINVIKHPCFMRYAATDPPRPSARNAQHHVWWVNKCQVAGIWCCTFPFPLYSQLKLSGK